MRNSKNKGPLNTYEVKISGYDQPLTVQGHSASAAKYAAYLRLEIGRASCRERVWYLV